MSVPFFELRLLHGSREKEIEVNYKSEKAIKELGVKLDQQAEIINELKNGIGQKPVSGRNSYSEMVK